MSGWRGRAQRTKRLGKAMKGFMSDAHREGYYAEGVDPNPHPLLTSAHNHFAIGQAEAAAENE